MPDVKECWSVKTVSEKLVIPRSTINSAIARGELHTYVMGDGSKVVRIADVKHWASKERKRGPKPKPRP